MFWFIRPTVLSIVSKLFQQRQIVEGVIRMIQGFVQKVMGSWKGGDEVAFQNAVQNQLIPAMQDLASAIGTTNINFDKSTNRIDQADAFAKKVAQSLRGRYSQI